MEDIHGNKIEEVQEIGTRKYIIKINNRYIVDFKPNEERRGQGSYSNGVLNLHALYNADTIIVSDNKEDSYIYDSRITIAGIIEKVLKNYGYKFYDLEVIEIEEQEV